MNLLNKFERRVTTTEAGGYGNDIVYWYDVEDIIRGLRHGDSIEGNYIIVDKRLLPTKEELIRANVLSKTLLSKLKELIKV